ncbi:MAG: MBL fold metallo-hydrolase [Clostridium sp.]|nr:MBL fold metallo-hydrolase [Clostridium sp.]MCM1443744.1 MBL fold metallo-hydrolase [Candidatus Amulumruptor caecigallinarius]
MKVCVLSSGSKGNSCYVKEQDTEILIDLGTTSLYIERNLKELSTNPENIKGIIITHTHVDHVDALRVFTKKYNTKVYLTEIMYKELKLDLPNYEFIDNKFIIGNLTITPFKTSHDVEDSNGYIIEGNDKSLVYVTDTGYINIKCHKLLENKDLYIFESNHDIDMLMNNTKYPYHIKQRILGDNGHLSNKDSSRYLKKFAGPKTKHIILAHLSEENNDPDLAIKTLKEQKIENCEIIVAKQHEKTELIEV